jgi:LytS/YehU family sensor histidine kinase
LNPSEVHSISPKELEEILLHFSQSMTEISSEDELLWDLVENCIVKLNFEDAVVYLLDEAGQYLEQKAALGPKTGNGREILQAIRIPVGKGVTGQVVTSGLPRVIRDTRESSDYIQDDQFRLSEVAVPILLEGKVIGVIDSEHSQPDYFSDQHVRILNAVASIYSGQIARIRAEKKLKEKQESLFELQRRNYQFQLEALSAQLSPHFVFNSLNSIQNQIFREDKENSLRFLSIFSKLLRYFLNQIHEEKARLNEEIQMIRWYLQLQKLRYDSQVDFQVSVAKEVKESRALIPALVLQNLIENLLEEQIQSSDGNTSIQLQVSEEDKRILISVLVSATGLPTKRKSPENRTARPWEQFVALINELRPYQIYYQIQDSGTGLSGKTVTLSLPNLYDHT